MARKRFALLAQGKPVGKNARHISDSRIDFSDAPESTDQELRKARRVGRPVTGQAKQLIAIRISPQVLTKLRKMAAAQHKPYQSLIHELLVRVTKKAA